MPGGRSRLRPALASAADVWAGVVVEAVEVDPAARDFQVEIRLTSAWDEELTLGLRSDDRGLIEPCRNVGP